MLTQANRTELHLKLRTIWALGSRPIVGWHIQGQGLLVFTADALALDRIAERLPSALGHDRRLKDEASVTAMLAVGCRNEHMPLSFPLADGADSYNFINTIVREYSLTHYSDRCVALYDIVGFSLCSAFQQAAQINLLSYCIKWSEEKCRARGFPVDLRTSTTGDGFYAWNNVSGVEGDIGLYWTVMLSLALIYALREKSTSAIMPRMRCCISFGDYYQFPYGAGTARGEYVVGDATVSAARIIAVAVERQLLFGNQRRRLHEGDLAWAERNGIPSSMRPQFILDTPRFVSYAQREAGRFIGLPVPGGKIKGATAYLTGPRSSPTVFSIRRYHVADKHGIDHVCFNGKFNLTLDGMADGSVYFGLPHDALALFKATWMAEEDIELRLR